MKLGTLIILFLTCFGCKSESGNKSNPIESERFEILPEPDKAEKENYLKQQNLASFLENPIDLQKFKKTKKKGVTTGVRTGMDYYYQPEIKDSIFYTYNYPTENFTDSKKIDQIVVFKHGKNKHTYNDETEILIELRIFNKDSYFEKANLVGISKKELESKFGTDYLTFDGGIAYSDKNKVLILVFENYKVKSFNYIKLNTEKIDVDLIELISK